jgi:ComF family protein
VPLAELIWLVAPPLCWGCGEAIRGGGPICRHCRAELRWLDTRPVEAGGVEAWAPLAYDGPARALVGGLKFHGAAGLADSLAAPIAAAAPEGWLSPPIALVPVPLHRARRRGFNQAERLARALARRTGLPVRNCLERTGAATTQVGRGRVQRVAGIDGAIRARPGHRAPSTAVIVDDVITTGATLAASAGALRAAGCRSVRAVAYARTIAR